jgi:hypothetical protein
LIAVDDVGAGEVAHHQTEIDAVQQRIGIGQERLGFAEVETKAAHPGVDVHVGLERRAARLRGVAP